MFPYNTKRRREKQAVFDLIVREFIPRVRFTADDIYSHESEPKDLDMYAALEQLEFEKRIQKVVRLFDDSNHTTMVYCQFTPKGRDGYNPCFCRDCFNTTIGPAGELCDDCEEAGCDPTQGCLGKHAYEQHCGDENCCGPYEED